MSPSETFLRLRALAPRDGSATRDEAADEPPPGAAVERAFGLRFGCDAEHPAPRDDDAPCAPEVDARGRVSCACAGCARWKSYLDGALGAPVARPPAVRGVGPRARPSARRVPPAQSPRAPRPGNLAARRARGRRRRRTTRAAPHTSRPRHGRRGPHRRLADRRVLRRRRPLLLTPPTPTSATTRAFRASGDPSLPNPRRGCFEWTRWSPSRTRGPQPSRRFQSLMSFCVAGNRWAWTGPPRCARGRACASTCWWARRTTGYAASRGPRGDRARVRTRAANSRTNSRTKTRTRMTRPPTQVGKPGSNPRGRRTRWTGSSASSSRR